MNSKFVISIFAFFTLMFMLAGCEKLEKAEEELHTLQMLYEEAEVSLYTLQDDIEKANAEILSLRQKNEELESERETLYTKLGMVHLDPLGSEIPNELFEKKWMFGEGIEVWKVPAGVESKCIRIV